MSGWFDSCNVAMGFVSSAISIFSAVFALLAWRKARLIRAQQVEDERLRAEPIRLILVSAEGGDEHILGYRPRRDQATRAEILGILGIYSGEPRFESSRLVPILEDGTFDRMIAGQASELRVQVSQADFERFVHRDKELEPGTA